MAKVGEALTGGQSLQELGFLAAGGAASQVVQKLVERFAPAAIKDILKAVPVNGAASLLAGAAVYAAGDQLKNKTAREIGRALVAVAAVQAGSSVGSIASNMALPAPAATGTAGISYHPDFAGVDVSRYGKAEFDIGVEGVPKGLGYGQLGRRPDQFNPNADFEGMGNGVPEGMGDDGQMG